MDSWLFLFPLGYKKMLHCLGIKCDCSDIHVCCPRTNPEKVQGIRSVNSLSQDIAQYIWAIVPGLQKWINGRKVAVYSAVQWTAVGRTLYAHQSWAFYALGQPQAQLVPGQMQGLFLAIIFSLPGSGCTHISPLWTSFRELDIFTIFESKLAWQTSFH